MTPILCCSCKQSSVHHAHDSIDAPNDYLLQYRKWCHYFGVLDQLTGESSSRVLRAPLSLKLTNNNIVFSYMTI